MSAATIRAFEFTLVILLAIFLISKLVELYALIIRNNEITSGLNLINQIYLEEMIYSPNMFIEYSSNNFHYSAALGRWLPF